MINARPATTEKAIARTLDHRAWLISNLSAKSYYVKDSPRKIDIRRETEILGVLMEMRNA